MAAIRRYVVRRGEDETAVDVLADGLIRVGEAGEVFAVAAAGPGEFVVSGGGRVWRVAVAGPADGRWVGCEGVSACVEVQPEGESRTPRRRAVPGMLAAPMPGTIIDVAVAVGQQVRAGDVLLTLEAMKMELPIRAPRDGIVSAVRCAPGELVQPGPPLVELS
jgi:acetyl/propionyl-CoA carboxylase alpha subunit